MFKNQHLATVALLGVTASAQNSNKAMSGVQKQDENGNYHFVHLLTVGEDTVMQAALDTTTHRSLIAGTDCQECEGSKYDVAYDVLQGQAWYESQSYETRYGAAPLWVNDMGTRICLDGQDSCFLDQDVSLNYVKQDDYGVFSEPVEAVLGLARYGHKYAALQNSTNSPNQESYMWSKFQTNQPSFMIHQRDEENTYSQSAVFGFIDYNDQGNKIYLEDDYFWSSYTKGVQFGDEDWAKFGFESSNQTVPREDGGVYTIFDAASKDVLVSELWWDEFSDQFKALIARSTNYTAFESSGRLVVDCREPVEETDNSTDTNSTETNSTETNSTETNTTETNTTESSSRRLQAIASDDFFALFPQMYFLVDGAKLQIRPEDYMTHNADGVCETRFKSIDAPLFVLGAPVYRDYRVVHYNGDGSNYAYISFMNGYSTKDRPDYDFQTPEKALKLKYEHKQSENPIAEASISAVVVSLLIGAIPGGAIFYYLLYIDWWPTIAGVLFGLDAILVYFLGKRVLFPEFLKSISRESIEWPVLSNEDALRTLFGVDI